MELNPYESPREPEPLAKSAKRGIGVATILLLMPLAVLIAFGASCAASIAVVEVVNSLEAAIVTGLTAFFGPPILTLFAMIWWAIRAGKRKRLERELRRQQYFREVSE